MNKAYGKIVSNFSIDGSVKSIEPLGNGLLKHWKSLNIALPCAVCALAFSQAS